MTLTHFWKVLSAACLIAMVTTTASADVLCAKKAMKASKKGKVAFSKGLTTATGSTCPNGYIVVLDTSIFQGPQGPTGAQGAKGDTGETGSRGQSAFDPLPAGKTITGRFYRDVSQTTSFFEVESAVSEMPGLAGSTIANSSVVLKQNSVVNAACPTLSDCVEAGTLATSNAKSSLCTGTAQLPTAPAGLVCVYPFVFDNITLQLHNIRHMHLKSHWIRSSNRVLCVCR